MSKKSKISPATTRFPTPMATKPPKLSKEEKIDFIATRFEEIMQVLGLDLKDDSLARTPQRIARMYVNEIFAGLDPENFPSISFFEEKFQHGKVGNFVFMQMQFSSFCEHHFVPFVGRANVGYIPNGKIIGLSKIPRIVRFFSRRPQVQERLTAQIADSLALLLGTEDVAVSLEAEHYCILARGIEDTESNAITNVLRGAFEENTKERSAFFEAINRSHS